MQQTATVDQLFEQIKQLSRSEQFQLAQTILVTLFQQINGNPEISGLNRADKYDLPPQTTLEEAITLYQTDQCSLAKAADLAGMTRWALQDVLYERGTPVEIYVPDSVEAMDARFDEMAQDGILC